MSANCGPNVTRCAASGAPSASSPKPNPAALTAGSRPRLGERDDGDLHLAATLHVLLPDLLVAARDLLAQQPVVQDVARRRPRRRLAQRHHQTGDERRRTHDA